MKADRLARLCRIAGGAAPALLADGVTVTPAVTPKKPGVTPVTPVTPLARGKGKDGQGSAGPDPAEIDERAGIASASVPALYLDAWARLNCQKPFKVSEAEWRLALDDGGRFLDNWGTLAAELQWSAGDLFDVPREGWRGGLAWEMRGERVEALGADHARLGDGRTIMRLTLTENRCRS